MAIFPDGNANEGQSGTTHLTFTVRRAGLADNGSSFLLGDGSVRFLRDAIDGWQYQRRDGAGETVAEGPVANSASFAFGDGSVRFLADGLSSTVLFGEEDISLQQAQAAAGALYWATAACASLATAS